MRPLRFVHRFVGASALVLAASSAEAGPVSGVIRTAVAPGARAAIAVVYAEPVDTAAPRRPGRFTLRQKHKTFQPSVLAIPVGSTVDFPNDDAIFHNVFSMSDAKEFDLGYYKKEKVPEVRFDRVGRVDVFCAIHPKMHCIILVVPNPFFAVADDKGRFVIKDVPAGTYKVRAWHERIPSQTREIVVPATGDVKIDFTLGLGELPKY